jgi:hypothetical protein
MLARRRSAYAYAEMIIGQAQVFRVILFLGRLFIFRRACVSKLLPPTKYPTLNCVDRNRLRSGILRRVYVDPGIAIRSAGSIWKTNLVTNIDTSVKFHV